jgi:hypothetical protein
MLRHFVKIMESSEHTVLVNTQLEKSEISTEAKTSLAFFVVKKQNKKSRFI